MCVYVGVCVHCSAPSVKTALRYHINYDLQAASNIVVLTAHWD